MRSRIQQRLPTGFRHLFSRKEIRDLQAQAGVRFYKAEFGHVVHRETYHQEQPIHSDIRPVSIAGWKDDEDWLFTIHQGGFRAELLPKMFEANVKADIKEVIVNYVQKIATSTDTDLIKRPQLWISVLIANNRVMIKARELN